jgi:3-deoxy-manno-octulosonate cytidylyltransferase (CMP-KDO synthetase)
MGKPLIEHVYSRAREAKTVDRVVVATDDMRIMEAVRQFGGDCVMTDTGHRISSSMSRAMSLSSALMSSTLWFRFTGEKMLLISQRWLYPWDRQRIIQTGT